MRAAIRSAAIAVALGGVVLGSAAPASADTVDDGTPGLLTIDAQPRELQLELDPGMQGDWLLTPRLDAESSAAITLQITSEGVLAENPAGLRVSVEECPGAWAPAPGGQATCAAPASVLLPPTAFADIPPAESFPLGTLTAGGERYLRVIVALPDPAPGELQGGHAEFALGFSAAGELVVVDPVPVTPSVPSGGTPSVAQTGVVLGVPLALAALLGAAGAALRVLDRRRVVAR
jgi:hypothetical protein